MDMNQSGAMTATTSFHLPYRRQALKHEASRELAPRQLIANVNAWLRELLEKTPDGLALVANASTIVQFLRDLARSLS